MHRRFKDPQLDKCYCSLLDNTPDDLDRRQIYGTIAAAFRRGYNGYPKPHFIARNTFAYAAYIAGKESIKR